jgi:hypothetical protein
MYPRDDIAWPLNYRRARFSIVSILGLNYKGTVPSNRFYEMFTVARFSRRLCFRILRR